MKLPDIQHRRVSTPQSQSPMAAVSKYRDKQNILQAGIKAGQVIAEEKVEYDTVKANAEYRDKISGVQEYLAGKDELTRDELIALGASDSNANINWQDEQGEPITTFKKYEVEAALMSQVMDDQLSEAGNSIASTKYRDAWKNSVRENNAAEILRVTNRTARDAKDYEYKSAIADMEALGPDARIEYAKTSPALADRPEVRQKYIKEAEAESFDIYSNNIIDNGSDKELSTYISDMTDPDKRSNLKVNERTARILTNRAKSELRNREIRAGQYQAKNDVEANRIAKDFYTRYKTDVENGVEVSEIDKEIVLANTSGTPYADGIKLLDQGQDFAVMSKDERSTKIESLGGLDDAFERDVYIAEQIKIEKALDQDAYAFGVRQGIIDYEPISLGQPETYQRRINQAAILSDHYGRDVSPFAQGEIQNIADAMPRMTTEDIMSTINTFSQTPEVWEQFAKADAGMYAVVGTAGSPSLMRSAIEGQKLINSGEYKQPTQTDYMVQTSQYLGGVYPPEIRAMVIETTQAVYATKIAPGDEFDSDLWHGALESVTGGITEINGNKVQVPRDTDPDLLQDYVDGFSAAQVARYGGVLNMDDEQAARAIRDGDWYSSGNNKYRVNINGVPVVTPAKDGQPSKHFEVIYNKDTATGQAAKAFSRGRQESMIMRRDSFENLGDL